MIPISAGEKHPLDCRSVLSTRNESLPHIVKGKQRTLSEKASRQILHHQLNFSLGKTKSLSFTQDCLLTSSSAGQERDSLQARPVPKVKHASHVNETVTRLTIYTTHPSPCHTKHFTATVAAFLWLVPQQSGFTLGNGLTRSSQSLRTQSASSCLFLQRRRDHTDSRGHDQCWYCSHGC